MRPVEPAGTEKFGKKPSLSIRLGKPTEKKLVSGNRYKFHSVQQIAEASTSTWISKAAFVLHMPVQSFGCMHLMLLTFRICQAHALTSRQLQDDNVKLS